MLYPIFAADSFWSEAESCKLMGVRRPAAPLGKCCATWSVSALFVRTSGDAMGSCSWNFTYELFTQLRLDGKPGLIFAGHLANWELPALAAVAHGLDTAILYRRPNIASADHIIQDMRVEKNGYTLISSRP